MEQRLIQRVRQKNLNTALKDVGVGANSVLARELGCNPSYVSNMRRGQKTIGDDIAQRIEKALSLPANSLDRITKTDPAGVPDTVSVPELEAAPGTDYQPSADHPSAIEFSRHILDSGGFLGSTLRCYRNQDCSMIPAIRPGDNLILEMDPGHPIDRAVYLIQWGDLLRCRRIFLQPSGAMLLRCDNPDKSQYPDERARIGDQGFRIVARAIWRGGWV